MRVPFVGCFISTLIVFNSVYCLDAIDNFQSKLENYSNLSNGRQKNDLKADKDASDFDEIRNGKSSINFQSTLPRKNVASSNSATNHLLINSPKNVSTTNDSSTNNTTTTTSPTNLSTTSNVTNITTTTISPTYVSTTNIPTKSQSNTKTVKSSTEGTTKKQIITTTIKYTKFTTSKPSNNSFYTTPTLKSTTPRFINNGSDTHNESKPVAKAKSGTYLGYWSVTSMGVRYASFSGIRYVKPMTPLNRFQWAELVDDSNDVIDATKEGSECPQWNIHRKSNAITGNEDCLFMNIYTPQVNGSYPVMVVLPCGHFVFDSSSRDLNGPDYFMNTQEIVMVIFNYRLGPLGFADFRSDKYPSNLGMKDQVLALKWVQKNIAAFGGDPKKVTLQGTSSGAVSVHYHMISPLSKGLFHAGISESGTALDPWSTVYPHRARELLILLASKTGCEWAVPVSHFSSADLLAECFRNKSAHQLLAATRHFSMNLVQMVFLPVLEVSKKNPFVPKDPYIAPEHPLPWLSGQNSDETGIITSLEKPIYWLMRMYISAIAYEGVPRWLNFAETASDPWNVTASIMYHYARTYNPSQNVIVPLFKSAGEDAIFWNPHYLSMLKHKGTKYSYIFGYRQTKHDGTFLHPDRGVTHSEEQFYLFIKQGVDIQKHNPPADAAMSKTLVRLWTNFVKYHNPTPIEEKTVPKWDKWTEDNNLFYTIGQTSINMEVDPKLESYKFWRTLPYRDKMTPFPYYPENKTRNTRPPHHWHIIPNKRHDSSSTKHLPLNILPLISILIILYIL